MQNNLDESLIEVSKVAAGGERVTHLWPNDCYYAHLAIYYFGLPYCQGKVVLDAGSGAGYGSAYLAKHGAQRVRAIEINPEAVAFSQKYFQRSNLDYQVMNLEQIQGFPTQSFDIIFSSNVLEHVPNVLKFLRVAWGLLKSEGTMVIAVPPVIDDVSRNANIENVFHLNIWTPRQWYHILQMFFGEVQGYRHTFEKPGVQLNLIGKPEDTVVNEKDFSFPLATLDEMYRETITELFVAHNPLPRRVMLERSKRLTFVDDSFTRQPHISVTHYLLRRSFEVLRNEGPASWVGKVVNRLKG